MKTAKVVDVVNDCSCILEFLSYSFSLLPPGETAPGMTYPEQAGLALILGQTSDRLARVGITISHLGLEMEV